MAALSITYSCTNNPNLMEILKKQKQNPCLYHPVGNIFIHIEKLPSKTHYFNNIWGYLTDIMPSRRTQEIKSVPLQSVANLLL